MTTRIDFEDCGAFVRFDDDRTPKSEIASWSPKRQDGVIVGVFVERKTAVLAYADCGYTPCAYAGTNAAEVLAALDEAMQSTEPRDPYVRFHETANRLARAKFGPDAVFKNTNAAWWVVRGDVNPYGGEVLYRDPEPQGVLDRLRALPDYQDGGQ